MSEKKPWQKTIEEYLDGSRVNDYWQGSISDAQMAAQTDAVYPHVVDSPRMPDYAFHIHSHHAFKIVHKGTGEVAGGFVSSVAYVKPEHRGRGLMAEMYALLDETGFVKEHWSLTPMSLASRCGAHRIHVQDALKRGDPVPLDVVRQYAKGPDGRLRLRTPYDAAACNARAAYVEKKALWSAHTAAAARLDTSFVPRDETSEIRDVHAVVDYVSRSGTRSAAGLRLAGALAGAHGGTIRMLTTKDPSRERRAVRFTAFCAVIDGQAVDALGARDEAVWVESLVDFGVVDDHEIGIFFGKTPLIHETRDFASVEACVRWMREEGIPFTSRSRVGETFVRDREIEDLAITRATIHAHQTYGQSPTLSE